MPVIYHQSFYKRCNACGHRVETTDERLRKCPACGKPRLARTGRLRLVVGQITISQSPPAERG